MLKAVLNSQACLCACVHAQVESNGSSRWRLRIHRHRQQWVSVFFIAAALYAVISKWLMCLSVCVCVCALSVLRQQQWRDGMDSVGAHRLSGLANQKEHGIGRR